MLMGKCECALGLKWGNASTRKSLIVRLIRRQTVSETIWRENTQHVAGWLTTQLIIIHWKGYCRHFTTLPSFTQSSANGNECKAQKKAAREDKQNEQKCWMKNEMWEKELSRAIYIIHSSFMSSGWLQEQRRAERKTYLLSGCVWRLLCSFFSLNAAGARRFTAVWSVSEIDDFLKERKKTLSSWRKFSEDRYLKSKGNIISTP